MAYTPISDADVSNFGDIQALIDGHVSGAVASDKQKALISSLLTPYLTDQNGPFVQNKGKSPRTIFNFFSSRKKKPFRFSPLNADRRNVNAIADWVLSLQDVEVEHIKREYADKPIGEIVKAAECYGFSPENYKDKYPETAIEADIRPKFKSSKISESKAQDMIWKSFSPLSQDEFKEEFLKGLPDGTKLSMVFDSFDLPVSMEVNYEGEHGKFKFKRVFDTTLNSVQHERAEVEGQALKDMNVNKILQERFFELYNQKDIGEIKLDAVGVGCYAWGRIGFTPDAVNWEEAVPRIMERIDFMCENAPSGEDPLDPEYAEFLKKVLSDKDPKAFWAIVDQGAEYGGHKIGKVLVISWTEFDNLRDEFLSDARDIADRGHLIDGVNWSGQLRLDDKDAVKRFKSYVKAKPAVSPKADMRADVQAQPASKQRVAM